MHSEFVFSICPLPPKITESLKEKIDFRVTNIEGPIIANLLDNYHHAWSEEVKSRVDNLGEDHLFKVDSIEDFFKKEIATELIKEALAEIIYKDAERSDLGHMFLEHKWWVVSGGSSWGALSQDTMRYIDIIEDSKILLGLNQELIEDAKTLTGPASKKILLINHSTGRE